MARLTKKEMAEQLSSGSEHSVSGASRPNGDAVMFLNRPRLVVKIGDRERLLDINTADISDDFQRMVTAINADNLTSVMEGMVENLDHGQEITIRYTVSIPSGSEAKKDTELDWDKVQF